MMKGRLSSGDCVRVLASNSRRQLPITKYNVCWTVLPIASTRILTSARLQRTSPDRSASLDRARCFNAIRVVCAGRGAIGVAGEGVRANTIFEGGRDICCQRYGK